jgi:hypothetical protein
MVWCPSRSRSVQRSGNGTPQHDRSIPMMTTTVPCTNCGAPITIDYNPTIDVAELADALSWAICDDCYRAEISEESDQ